MSVVHFLQTNFCKIFHQGRVKSTSSRNLATLNVASSVAFKSGNYLENKGGLQVATAASSTSAQQYDPSGTDLSLRTCGY